MTVASGSERIGLLFVHGIGEQQRWDHLKSSVQELAELLLQTDGNPRATVIDRTADWPHAAGHPDPGGLAPMTLLFTSSTKQIEFECHEVWWADLGSRSGMLDVVMFWLWGLGQWAAPIYRELDASGLPKKKLGHLNKPVSTDAALPESVAGNLRSEPLSRLQLVLAALAAMFVAVTWSLTKRLFAALLGQAPTPTLIVRYVGDVRTYESRAAPGDSSLSDPGRPRRVGIRRRMVREMVALGTGTYHGWYVLAHSLGTVVAYNGLTETGHALPNYLPQEQWQRVPAAFKQDTNCRRRSDVSGMMPARAPWLNDQEVINRKLLFQNLRGFLTYGSPLDKFAALWPRIVATATDQIDGSCPFPAGCRWINLAAPSDPVAGTLDSYGSAAGQRLESAIPTVENYRTPWNAKYGLAHIKYFAGVERHSGAGSAKQKRAVAKWLLGNGLAIKDHQQPWPVRLVTEKLAYPLLVALLWGIATAFIVAVIQGLETATGRDGFSASEFYGQWCAMLRPVLAASLALILLMGLFRWCRETALNLKLARDDKVRDLDQTPERHRYWGKIIWMQGTQSGVALLFLLGALGLLILAMSLIWQGPWNWLAALGDGSPMNSWTAAMSDWWRKMLTGGWPVIIVSVGLVLAALAQTLVNMMVPPVGKAPG